MALIQISDNVMINSSRIDSIEAKKDKTWVSVGNKSFTIDMPVSEFVRKVGIAEQSEGGQHWAG